jgi:hypothetical protein
MISPINTNIYPNWVPFRAPIDFKFSANSWNIPIFSAAVKVLIIVVARPFTKSALS